MTINSRATAGILLVVGGILFLLMNLGVISGNFANIFWTVVLGAGAVFFLSLFRSSHRAWWAVIPGVILLGLALSNALEFLPGYGGGLENGILLGSIGISFWIVYFSSRINWWAIIPGGVLLSLAVVDLLEQLSVPDIDTEGVFFLGLGLTFLLLFLLPTGGSRLRWPIWPALGLLLYGASTSFGAGDQVWNFALPAAVIILGIYLLFGALRRKPGKTRQDTL
jgi:hypothetical protein